MKKRVDEILRISTNLISAVNDIRVDVKEIKVVQDEHTRKFEKIESDVSTLKGGQKKLEGMIADGLYKIIELQNRMDKVEQHLKSQNERFNQLETKVDNIQTDLLELSNKVGQIAKSNKGIKELETRVEKLEEEVFA